MTGFLCVLFSVGACAAPALAFAEESETNRAIDEAFGDHVKYEAVILSLQKAVAAHDAGAVSGPALGRRLDRKNGRSDQAETSADGSAGESRRPKISLHSATPRS